MLFQVHHICLITSILTEPEGSGNLARLPGNGRNCVDEIDGGLDILLRLRLQIMLVNGYLDSVYVMESHVVNGSIIKNKAEKGNQHRTVRCVTVRTRG